MNLIETLVNEDMIRTQERLENWQEAVRVAVECLVEKGRVLWGYYDAILRTVEKNGPYFVLMPGVALPHARPEDGVISWGISLITLQKPVNFGMPENDPIQLLLCFATTRSDVDIKKTETFLAQASLLFEDRFLVKSISTVASVKRMHEVLRSIDPSKLEENI